MLYFYYQLGKKKANSGIISGLCLHPAIHYWLSVSFTNPQNAISKIGVHPSYLLFVLSLHFQNLT